jgi:hypothetical protein
MRRGKRQNIFVSPSQAYISVSLEMEGEAAKRQLSKLKSQWGSFPAGMQRFAAGQFIGFWFEKDLDSKRREQGILIVSPDAEYTMMTSWPKGDAAAKKDADFLAKCAIWSVRRGK